MATNDYDNDDDFDIDESDTNSYNDGSDLLKKLRKAKRADEKRIKELTEALETESKFRREQIVNKVLDQQGVNPKAARLILKDLDTGINEEAVNSWLEDNGDLFGYTAQKQVDPQQQLDRAALRQQDIVTQGAVTPSRDEDVMSRVNNASEAELLEMIRSGNF